MLAAANAAVVPGRVTETVAAFAATVATRKLGTKSRSCLAAAITSCFRAWFPHPPSMRPLASNSDPPNANRRPPRRRRAYVRRPGSFSISRRNVGPSSRCRSIASLPLCRNRSFIGEFLEQAIGRDAVIALVEKKFIHGGVPQKSQGPRRRYWPWGRRKKDGGRTKGGGEWQTESRR